MPLDITEYANLALDARGNVIPAGQEPSTTNQQLAIGGTSTPSLDFGGTTRFVRLHTDAACRVEFAKNPGTNPTASAASMRLPAGATEFFGVMPGYRLAVITTT